MNQEIIAPQVVVAMNANADVAVTSPHGRRNTDEQQAALGHFAPTRPSRFLPYVRPVIRKLNFQPSHAVKLNFDI